MTEPSDALAILVAAPDAVLRIDRRGRILDFQGSAEDVFGYSQSEIVGRSVSILVPEMADNLYLTETNFSSNHAKLRDVDLRLQGQHKSGRVFPVEIAIKAMGNGSQLEIVAIVRDVSQRTDHEATLAKLSRQFAAGSGHLALSETVARNGPRIKPTANGRDKLHRRFGH